MTLAKTWSSVIWTWPTATPKQRTFFSWNLIVERTSVSLLERSSAWEMGVGNFPALERPGPSRRGICLIRASDAKKASYFFASFLTSFLFLLSLGGEMNAGAKSERFCARTSSSRRRTCTRGRFAWHGRYRRHQQGCKWTSLAVGRLGVCERESDSCTADNAGADSLYGSGETLISLWVVVFQTDLQFDGLDEVAAFFSRGSKEFLDRAPHT